MNHFDDLIGRESELDEVGAALKRVAVTAGVPVVGACHVTCSDEAEWECAEAFQRLFAAGLLPRLTEHGGAPFRCANLGARYERGAVRIAEDHFALAQPKGAAKLMVVKINAHVGVRPGRRGPEYGISPRYGGETACCGALGAVLAGGEGPPAVVELARTFGAGGRDRLAALLDPKIVPPHERALRAAVASARLQTYRAVADVRESRPRASTLFLVLPCVTVNRPGPDTEIVVGVSTIDWTGDEAKAGYRGLGDDPGAYRVRHDLGRLVVRDPQWP